MVDLFLRFEHAYEMLAAIVKSGNYGSLKKLQVQRNTAPIGGDLGPNTIVTALMIHDIDFVSYLLGKPTKYQTEKVLGKERECAVSVLCSYENALAKINASSMMPLGYPFSVSYEAVLDNAVVRYYEKMIRHAVKMVHSTEKPINDITTAAISLEMALKIQDMILS